MKNTKHKEKSIQKNTRTTPKNNQSISTFHKYLIFIIIFVASIPLLVAANRIYDGYNLRQVGSKFNAVVGDLNRVDPKSDKESEKDCGMPFVIAATSCSISASYIREIADPSQADRLAQEYIRVLAKNPNVKNVDTRYIEKLTRPEDREDKYDYSAMGTNARFKLRGVFTRLCEAYFTIMKKEKGDKANKFATTISCSIGTYRSYANTEW